MNPIITIEDNAFFSGKLLKQAILDIGFSDVTSPIDGVTYPDICMLNDHIKNAYKEKIEQFTGVSIKPNFMFARIMKAGVHAPHKFHEDSMMGGFSAHLYLSEEPKEGMGTAFCKHKLHGPYFSVAPVAIGDDHHKPDNWDPYLFVTAKFNRLLIHDSRYFHAALPFDGFGDSPENARMALTCFFNVEDIKDGT